jgi:hypothetical protein
MTDTGVPPAANDSGGGPSGGMPLFYVDPRPLDPSILGGYGLKRSPGFGFAAQCHAIPISLSEFALVQKHYPIVFAPGDPPMPLIALSMMRNENLFIDAKGQWADDYYIPAYVRRYPFVLGEVPNEDRMFLCVDVSSNMVQSASSDIPFFDDQKPTEIVNQALELCRRFHEDLMVTKAFCTELNKIGLLRETELTYTEPNGNQIVAGTFVTIDYQALEKLPDTQFLDLRTRNLLPGIFMQQSSQTNWPRLAMRRQKLATTGGMPNTTLN